MAADSGRLRDACAHAHTGSERAVGYKLSRGEVGFWPVFGTATMPTSTSGASSRSEDGLLSPLVHEMSLSHGRRGPDRVFVHEMSLYHGLRGPDRVFVHEMSLYHGLRPDNGIFRIAK